jgi:hypothetical protein
MLSSESILDPKQLRLDPHSTGVIYHFSYSSELSVNIFFTFNRVYSLAPMIQFNYPSFLLRSPPKGVLSEDLFWPGPP